jgi:hypothetical protein
MFSSGADRNKDAGAGYFNYCISDTKSMAYHVTIVFVDPCRIAGFMSIFDERKHEVFTR